MILARTAAVVAIGCAALAIGAVAQPDGDRTPAESAPATTIQTQESSWDVFVENQKAGKIHIKVLTVRDLVIIEESLAATLRGKEIAFDNQIVYKTGAEPRPLRGKAATRLGSLKLMEGTAVFSDATVKTEISGYTDKDLKPLKESVQETKDTPVPAGLALTYPAFMYFAPKLLPEAGQIQKVSYLEFPVGVAFPEFIYYNPDCVLTRGPAAADGRTEFALRHVFSGGNVKDLASMMVDKAGKILEVRLRPFVFRPEGSGAAKPASGPAPSPQSSLPK
ncbi:MAG: hypothetical protein IMZ44_00525 [Planctomycetes bacterium]|nr:hypothetical protein [Planctomycetota bacterium]